MWVFVGMCVDFLTPGARVILLVCLLFFTFEADTVRIVYFISFEFDILHDPGTKISDNFF